MPEPARTWLSDPQKLLQLVKQAEGSGNAVGFDKNSGSGGDPHAPSIEEEIRTVVKLLTDLSVTAEHEKDSSLAILQEALAHLTPQCQGLLRELLDESAAGKTSAQPDEPFMVQLAASMAVRMARESFEWTRFLSSSSASRNPWTSWLTHWHPAIRQHLFLESIRTLTPACSRMNFGLASGSRANAQY